MSETDLFAEELGLLREKNLYRRVREMELLSPVRARIENREVVLFCSNDYLGLSCHPRVVGAFQKAAARYGIGAGAARLISGTSPEHAALETEIARFKGKPRAVLYTAGYLANLGVLTALAGKKDLIVMDKLCHASLVDGARLSGAQLRVFPHKNYERCEELLKKSTAVKKIIVTDTVFSMDGDLADLGALIQIKNQYGALLIADDAHGTGILGASGRGATEGFEEGVDVITGTLSKAAGGIGGYAATSAILAEYLINMSRSFVFATALPPACAAASRAAFQVMQDEPALRLRLGDHLRQLSGALGRQGFLAEDPVAPILPIMIGPEGEAVRISEALLKAGFLIPAVRTPTVPRGRARLRLTLSAAHETGHIAALVEALGQVLATLRGCPEKA